MFRTLFCCMALGWATGAIGAEDALTRLHNLNEKAKTLNQELTACRTEILSCMMADKVEAVTRNCRTDQERAIALAEWIGRTYHNTSDLWKTSGGGGVYGQYAFRIGPCGSRTMTHLQMADYVGIPGKALNLYHIGHTTSQLEYDGSMHFFDIQNGLYFMKDKRVLDFFEILADPSLCEETFRVTFPLSNATWGRREKRIRKNSAEDSRSCLTAPVFRDAPGQTKYYFAPGVRVAVRAELDTKKLQEGTVRYGEPGQDLFDTFRAQMYREGLGYYLGRFGTFSDYMDHRIVFKGAKAGERYRIVIVPLEYVGDCAGAFWADGNDVDITTGAEYSGRGDWKIEFTARTSDPSLFLRNRFEQPGRGFKVSTITFQRLNGE